MKIAAFDIGGTTLKMALATSTGELLVKEKQPIEDSDGEQILAAMLAWVARYPTCQGIAISAPGYVNPRTGFIAMGGAIRQFDQFPMKDWLEEKTGLPVAIENDANCVLLAERWQGKAHNIENFLVMTIGTGIGGAIFCNNQLVHGARFRAGEFGYMQAAQPGSDAPARTTMNEICTLRMLRLHYARYRGQDPEQVTGEEIFDRYDAGDIVCQRLVGNFFNGLCMGLYNLVNIFDPELVLIGGGIVERPGFLALLQQHLAWFGIDTEIGTVSHGNDAGMIGAIYHFNHQ